jgi:Leucine-rich repeat (LRR) protein
LGKLHKLHDIYLDNNKLQGHIPDSLGNALELVALALSSNYFTGQIPSSLGKLHKLHYLYLDNNKLEARNNQSLDILDALSNCPDLQGLSLYGNQLHGVLPNSIGNLSATLELLDLGANNLHGIVSTSIGALKNLTYLHLGGNNFVGTIPYSIGNLTHLKNLYLSDNQFDSW